MGNQRLATGISSRNVRLILLVCGISLCGGMMFYGQLLYQKISDRERKTAELFRSVFERALTMDDGFEVIEKVMQGIQIPLIITGPHDEPLSPYKTYIKNVRIPVQLSEPQQLEYLQQRIAELKQSGREPLEVKLENQLINKVYYGDSELATESQLLPYVIIFVVVAFIMLGYIGVSQISVLEHNRLLFGLSKEFSHQLGTPISGLFGWLEVIRDNRYDPVIVEEYIRQAEHDVERLQTIAERIGKIREVSGMPVAPLVEHNLTNVLEQALAYISLRLPRRSVRIETQFQRDVRARIDPVKIDWMLEILMKNSAQAITRTDGLIHLSLTDDGEAIVFRIRDNGKGMSANTRRNAFQSGFTTKEHGWGVGLSFVQSTLQEMGGTVKIIQTEIDKGTTFEIVLPSSHHTDEPIQR
jgi:signal transduction histidine kinase